MTTIRGGIIFGILMAASSWAQPAFKDLAPNGDGSVVYFSSPLRLKGTNEYPSQPKIFRWDEHGGVRLYEQRPPTITWISARYWKSATFYNLIAPSISSDGRTVAVAGLSDCNFSTPCVSSIQRLEAAIRIDDGEAVTMKGIPSLSPNGRFLTLGAAVLSPPVPVELAVVDLASGQRQSIMNSAGFPRRHSIADNGTTIAVDPELTPPVRVRSWSGSLLPLKVPYGAPLQIERSGRRVFYPDISWTSAGPRIRLIMLDVATNAATELVVFDTKQLNATAFDISDDGSLVAFLREGKVWLVPTDGTGLRPVTADSDKIAEMALSGTGNRLFAVTEDSRLLRIDLRTGSREEIIATTPLVRGLYAPDSFSPGESVQVRLYGPTLPEFSSVTLFDSDLRILSADPVLLLLQAPYDIPDGTGWPAAVLKTQGDGPFESAGLWSAPVQVAGYAPAWYTVGRHVAAIHQDFSGPITTDAPAHPNEIIHAYGHGFGRTEPQPPLGAPASADPISRTTTPFLCGLEGNNSKFVPAEILFAGLAPGWIGLYQFDIRLPDRPAGTDTYLVCGKPEDLPFGSRAQGLLPMVGQ